MTDAIHAFAADVTKTDCSAFVARAIENTKTFILGTLRVGLLGCSGPMAQTLPSVMRLGGVGNDARVWSTGQQLPAQSAALCNAYMMVSAADGA
jgi:2-methylcitrate dehydratase PrpD